MSNKNELVQLSLETLSNSTIHAIPNITRNKFKIIKFMWLICFLMSSSACCGFIAKSIMDYLKYDVVSNIQVDYQDRLIFPIVTICDLNMYSTAYANEVNYLLFKSKFPPMDLYLISQILSNILLESIGIDKTKLGYSLDNIIITCKFNNEKCNLGNDFESYFDVNYGNCFRFNSGKNMTGHNVPFKYAYQSGIKLGLELELFIGSSIDNDRIFSFENGFLIIINNDTINSFLHEGIKIPTGYSTNVIINSNVVRKIPKPYSECTENLVSVESYNSESYKKTINGSNGNYYFASCWYVCLQKHIGLNCGCQSTYMNLTFFPELKFCAISFNQDPLYTFKEMQCILHTIRLFTQSLEMKKECDCPIECEFNYYSYTTSFADYPTYQYYKYLINNTLVRKRLAYRAPIDYKSLRESVARVVLFYDNLRQTIVTEDIKTLLSDLISNIGGTLGLFLGNDFHLLISFDSSFFKLNVQNTSIIYKKKHIKSLKYIVLEVVFIFLVEFCTFNIILLEYTQYLHI
jgi:hypothetical protein